MYTSRPASVNSRATVTGFPAPSISVNRTVETGTPASSSRWPRTSMRARRSVKRRSLR